jgi:hypothetical protein
MSCTTVRQRLLACERPDKPAAAETRHLASCADCRAWLRRLVRLEQQISLVAVPPSSPPPALLAMLGSAPADALVKPPALLHAVRPRQETGRQKLSLALALAAALAVFAIGWWAWPHVQPPSRRVTGHISLREHDEFIAKQLRGAQTSAQRVAILIDLADGCFKRAGGKPEDNSNVERQSLEFRNVVKYHLPLHAQKVSPGERVVVLKDAANRLGRIKELASQLAGEWKQAHPASADKMSQIAADAGAAEESLMRLARA